MGIVRKYKLHRDGEQSSHVRLEKACDYHKKLKGKLFECSQVRIYPADHYDDHLDAGRLVKASTRLCILKVPLLGQTTIAYGDLGWGGEFEAFSAEEKDIRKKKDDWCARTSASMALNWFYMIQGGDPSERYITHWDGDTSGGKPCDQGQGWYRDLRWGTDHPTRTPESGEKSEVTTAKEFKTGARALHKTANETDDKLQRWNRSGYSTGITPDMLKHAGLPDHRYLTDNLVGGATSGRLLPELSAAENSKDAASSRKVPGSDSLMPVRSEKQFNAYRKLAGQPAKIFDLFENVTSSISKGNPVKAYTGISNTKWGNHIVLFIGWMAIKSPSGRGEDLWLVVADPSGASKLDSLFESPEQAAARTLSIKQLGNDGGGLKAEHRVITILGTMGSAREAGVYAIKASFLLEPHPRAPLKESLREVSDNHFLLDDPANPGAFGFFYEYCLTAHEVPPEVMITGEPAPMAMPMHSPSDPGGPIEYYYVNEWQKTGGYYPIGGFQNLHSGVHLDPIESDESQRYTPVRAIAPGRILAIRMHKAFPKDLLEKAEETVTNAEDAKEICGNSDSLILVRHQLRVFPVDGKEGQPELLDLHFLYLHLLEPEWDQSGGPHSSIAWLNDLARRRNGSITLLADALLSDPPDATAAEGGEPAGEARSRVTAGNHLWLTARPEGETPDLSGASVYGKTFLKSFAVALEEGADPALALYKGPSAEHVETITAMEAGKLITSRLAARDLIVGAGDPIGYVAAQSELGSAFFHFEIFDPSQEASGGVLARLEALASERLKIDAGNFALFDEGSGGDKKNYFESGAELDALFKAAGIPSAKDVNPSLPRSAYLGDPSGEYTPNHVTKLMRSEVSNPEAKLPFARKIEGAEGELGDFEYFATLRIDNPGKAIKSSKQIEVQAHFFRDPPKKGPIKVERGDAPNEAEPQEEALRSDLGLDPVTLKFTFDESGDPFTTTLAVPAAARFVALESSDCDLSAGSYFSTVEEDKDHFQRLVSTRFRNLRLLHHNEWTYQGMVDSLSSRFEDAKEVTTFASALAWWHCAEQKIEHPAGGGKSLFEDPATGGTPAPLPTETKAVKAQQMHPITAWWILSLLCKHGHAEFVTPQPHAGPDESLPEVRTMASAWLPVRERHPIGRVGDPLTILAIHDGPCDFTPDEPLKLSLRSEHAIEGGGKGSTAPAAREVPWADDAARLCLEADRWGKLRFEIEGGAGTIHGATEREIAQPHLASGPVIASPKSSEGSSFSWAIGFRDGLPRRIGGYVTLSYKKSVSAEAITDLSAFTESSVALRVVGVDLQEAKKASSVVQTASLTVVDGWVTGGPEKTDTKVSADFPWYEYLNAAEAGREGDSPLKIALALMEGLQLARTALKKGITPLKLRSDGLAMEIRSYSSSLARVLEDHVKSGAFASVEKVTSHSYEHKEKGSVTYYTTWVHVGEPPPPVEPGDQGAGTLELRFDAAEAYAKLIEEIQQEDPSEPELAAVEYVHVLFGLRFYSGGHSIEQPAPEPQSSEAAMGACVRLDHGQMEQAAGRAMLRVTAQAPSEVLTYPRIGALTAAQSAGQSYTLSAPLYGLSASAWKGAGLRIAEAAQGALSIKVTVKESAKASAPGHVADLSATVTQKDFPDQELRLHAEAGKPAALYGERVVELASSPELVLNTRTHIESVEVRMPDPAAARAQIEVAARIFGLPSSARLTAWLSESGPEPDPRFPSLPLRDKRFDSKSGLFVAKIAPAELSALLSEVERPGDELRLELYVGLDPDVETTLVLTPEHGELVLVTAEDSEAESESNAEPGGSAP